MNLRILGVVAAFLLSACQQSPPPSEGNADQASTSEPAAVVDSGPAEAGETGRESGPSSIVLPTRDATKVDTRVTAVRFSDSGDAETHVLGLPTNTFPSSTPTVYAEVQTNGTADEYTIYAKWLDPEGNVLSDYGMRLQGAGSQRTVINLGKPDGWAPGTYHVEVGINSKVERTESFVVR